MQRHSVLVSYDSLKKTVKNGLSSDNVPEVLDEVYLECISFLENLDKTTLNSKVEKLLKNS